MRIDKRIDDLEDELKRQKRELRDQSTTIERLWKEIKLLNKQLSKLKDKTNI